MKVRIRNRLASILALVICLVSTVLVWPPNVSGEEYPGQGKDQLSMHWMLLSHECWTVVNGEKS